RTRRHRSNLQGRNVPNPAVDRKRRRRKADLVAKRNADLDVVTTTTTAATAPATTTTAAVRRCAPMWQRSEARTAGCPLERRLKISWRDPRRTRTKHE